MTIDIRTLIFVLGLMHVIQVVVFIHQYLINKSYRGIGWWLLWSIGEVLGFAWMLLRENPSLRGTAVIGQNAMLVLGVIFLYIGILRFLERKENRAALLMIYAVFIAGMLFFIYGRNDIQVRGILLSLTLALVSFLSARALFVHKTRAIAASANFVAAIFMIHGLFFAFRAAMMSAGVRADDFFAPTAFNAAAFMDALIVAVLWTFGFIIMINQRLNAEMTEAKGHFELIFNTSPDGAVITSLDDGIIMDINRGFTALTGFTREDTIGKSSVSVHVWDNPADRQAVVGELRRKGFQENFEAVFRRKDGRRLPGLMSAKIITLKGRPHIISVTRDITERKKAEEIVRRKAEELQDKNDELTRFTNAVSHDLRSPLMTIRTFLGHLEEDRRSQNRAREEKDLLFIRTAADRMSLLLDELLRLSQVGRTMNPSQESPWRSIVKDALDLAAGRISQRGVQVRMSENPLVLFGDRARLVEVFQNLVDNAAKFMGDQPFPLVEIGVEEIGGEAVLFVRDNGLGIEPEFLPKIFELFEKLDARTEGVGLGLALVKRIVELHGGRIWAESEGLGKGTTIRFTLAVSPCSSKAT